MTEDTIVTVVATLASTATLWMRMRQNVPLSVYQPKMIELHGTINSQGKEIVALQGENKLLRLEVEHIKEASKK